MSLGRLLGWKLRIAWKGFAAGSRGRGWLWLPVVLVVASALAIGWGAAVEALFRGPIRPGSPLALPLLHALLFAGSATALFLAAGAAFSSLYAASDLELLFSAPLPERTVFLSKFAEVAATPLAGGLLFGLPAVTGLGRAWGAGAAYAAEAIWLLLATILGSVGMGLLLHLVVMRVVPPYRTREVGAAVGTLLGALIYAGGQLAPRLVPDGGSLPAPDRLSGLAHGPWPTLWAAEAWTRAAGGDPAGALGPLAAATLVAALPLALGLWLVPETFRSGWAGSRETGRRLRRRRPEPGTRDAEPAAGESRVGRRVGSAAGGGRGGWAPAVSVARKELRTTFRDLRLWSDTAYALVVAVVGFILPSGAPGREGPLPAPLAGVAGGASLWAAARGALVAALFAALVSGQVALTAYGREGKNLWILRAAPVHGSEVALGKLLAALAVSGSLSLLLAVAVTLLAGGGWVQATGAGLIGLAVAAGFSASALAAGASWARPEAEDVRHSVARVQALATMAAGDLLFAAALAAALLLGYLGWVREAGWLLRAGLLLAVAVPAGTVALAVSVAGRAWERLSA
ncbi:MAG: hypothetical protein QJR14_05270 [Bacillota bacterium]|nr:hypothetical protein [Bacillota bacterium]